jgi:hypothetical protein
MTLNWIEPSERMIFGPNLVIESLEIVHHIQSNLKAAKAQQKTMPTRDSSCLSSKQVIVCTFVSHLCEV